ncbi:hypothetical protein CQW23_34927 [Capsicum baccatum]|uniref:Protein TAR1 n=1 Tax=Capsicum baccatum TaxID=33114 RepID=A0A2G2UXH2_CAPBA|nr:hypothetical protein CQW23_34927 [Capsicum baccatum]
MIRFNGLLATSRAANRPRRRDPNISPDHSIAWAHVATSATLHCTLVSVIGGVIHDGAAGARLRTRRCIRASGEYWMLHSEQAPGAARMRPSPIRGERRRMASAAPVHEPRLAFISSAPPTGGLSCQAGLASALQRLHRQQHTTSIAERWGRCRACIDGAFGCTARELCSARTVWLPHARHARRAVAATAKRVELQPPLSATTVDVESHLVQPLARGAREASIRPAMTARPVIEVRCEGTTRCVTPRQTCPRPNGFGRNLGSRTRWFTGFCNSHQVSHFAMFFIDARGEISVVESRFRLQKKHRSLRRTPQMGRKGQAIDSSIPWRFLRRGSLVARRARWGARTGDGGGARAECRSTPPAQTPQLLNTFAGSFCSAGFDNDPSAGSPTETLLRLLLPLNDKVQWTSRDVAGSEPPTSPRSEHFTGSFNR